MKAAAAALILAAAGGSPSVPVLPADLRGDVRCVIVSLAIANNPDLAALGGIASLYWFGRLHGKLKPRELEDAIVAEALVMTAADMKLEAQRCGAEMQAEGAALTKMGEAITRRAERADTH